MNENILIKEFVKDKKVGAFFSTTKSVTKKMLNNINFHEAKILVEYGPGKGIITKHLLEQMQEDAVLYVFEINKNFINDLLRVNDKRLIVVNADAYNARTILKNKYKINKVDYVISTIPLTFYDRRKRKRIVTKTYNLLNENGKFITSQYTWLVYYLLKQRFHQTRVIAAIINIPPSIIFIGLK